MREWVLLLLVFAFSFSGISEKYELYREFLESKDPSLARRLLKEYPEAPFRDELILFLVEKIHRERPGEAKRLLLKLNLKKVPPDYHRKLARIWRKLGLPEKKLVLAFPEKYLKRLKRFSLSPQEREKVAKRLFRLRKYNYVVSLTRNCYLKGVSLYRLKRYAEAERILRNCDERKAKRYLLYAYIASGRPQKAEELVKRENDPYLYYLLGREFLERGDLLRAEKYLSLGNGEAPFYLALLYYMKGQYEKARESLRKYNPTKTINRAKKSFWLFKVELGAGREKEAIAHLVETSVYENFYGTIAKVFLGLKVYEPAVLVDVEEPELFFELKRIKDIGFTHYMRWEAFRNKERISRGDILLLLGEDPYLSIRLAVNKYGVSSRIYRVVSHPTPYWDTVRRVSEEFGISPALIYAVMRQESLFDPYAVSPSGAKGLMQLMDFTARWKAKRLGLKLRNIFDVYTNVLLGTAYLKFLKDYWGDDLVKVIASYNAGHGAVSRWRDFGDDFLFIEMIPYRETRNYVKRVLHNYYIYTEKLRDFF